MMLVLVRILLPRAYNTLDNLRTASRCSREVVFEMVSLSDDRNFPKGFSFGIEGIPYRHN